MATNISRNGAFPELVIELEPSTTYQSAPTPSPLAQTVREALREVLAWRPQSNDSKGFVAALNQAFTITEVDGHTEFDWTPRSYAVQADMGAVTGAQASIYARAKAALDQSVPLVEGVFPILADADVEDAESTRALITEEFTELVSELGRVGGPRIDRVEGLFDALLDADFNFATGDPEEVGGLLGVMGDRFGLDRLNVNRVEEEQNLTNWLIVVHHVIGLRSSWETLKAYFNPSATNRDVFLGTQLVRISRALNVVVESVHELNFVLDSVFIGAAERQVLSLDTNLTIAELSGWVERFASEEAPRIIREAGKDGVIALRSTVEKLQELVNKASIQANLDSDYLPAGFHTERSRSAWKELNTHMTYLFDLTSQINRTATPELFFVSPNPVLALDNTTLTVNGKNFPEGNGMTIELLSLDRSTAVTLIGKNPSVASSTALRDVFDLVTWDGRWTVIVKDKDGLVESLAEELIVVPLASSGPAPTPTPAPTSPPPNVTNVDPPSRPNLSNQTVKVSGTGFVRGITARLTDGQTDLPVTTTFINETSITVTLDLSQAKDESQWTIVVTNPDNQTDTWGPFTVRAPDPFLRRLEPQRVELNDEVEVIEITLIGTSFSEESLVSFLPPLTVNPVVELITGSGGTQLVVTVNVVEDDRGGHVVTIHNPNNKNSNSLLFEVTRSNID